MNLNDKIVIVNVSNWLSQVAILGISLWLTRASMFPVSCAVCPKKKKVVTASFYHYHTSGVSVGPVYSMILLSLGLQYK